MKYDYLIVGCGLYGSVFGRCMAEHGKSVAIIEKRNHIGGNIYTEKQYDIDIHIYGPHCFHTNNQVVWSFLNRFAEFNEYRHYPKASYKGKIYSLPFNMNTFHQLWGVVTPQEAKKKIESQKIKIKNPSNLEEWVLSQIGPDIYETLIYGYTKKQWQREPRELPIFIIRRLPFRLTYDDCYFDDKFQGIPINGYSHMIENIIDGLEIKLGTDIKDINWRKYAKKLVYSGSIDEFFNYKFGILEYRSLRFETEVVDNENFQGVSQINYTDVEVPYTRIIEHKHFVHKPKSKKSVITYEYPEEWNGKNNRYYPINDEKNNALYKIYQQEIKKLDDVIFGGRLASFKYLDMDTTIGQAFTNVKRELNIR